MFRLIAPQVEEDVVISLKYKRKIVENLIEHWFPHCNLTCDIDKVDCFLKMINSYQWWMDSIPFRVSGSFSVIEASLL